MFELPPPRRYRLERPPLAQALAQVQYDVRARIASLDGIAPIQERLEEFFPYMARVEEPLVSVVFGPSGEPPPPQTIGSQTAWSFSDDAGWNLVLAPEVATLAVGPQYESVNEISERFRAVVGALVEAGHVRRCNRLGVRYINVAELPPGDEEAWRRWYRPEFVGWVGGEILAGQLVASVTQTQMASGGANGGGAGILGGMEGIIRQGVVPPNTLVPGLPAPVTTRAYLTDMDLFVAGPQPMSQDELGQQFLVLHSQIDRFFRWTLSPAGEEYFGLMEVEEG